MKCATTQKSLKHENSKNENKWKKVAEKVCRKKSKSYDTFSSEDTSRLHPPLTQCTIGSTNRVSLVEFVTLLVEPIVHRLF